MSRKPLALIATALIAVFTTGTSFANKKASFSSYARVTHVEPVYKFYTVREPQKHCEYIRPQRPRQATYNNHRRYFTSGSSYGQSNRQSNNRVINDSNRVNNRQARNSNNRNNGNRNFGNRGRQHCVTRTVSRQVRRQDGFRVTYLYEGNKFQTRTDYHPGRQIRISVQIVPH